MKKILLGTTGLVGAALIASAASAETPKVTLGGFSDFQAGYSDQDVTSTKRDGLNFRNDNEVSIHVDGKTDAGLGYGAVIDLEADATDDADNQGTNAARTFTYLESGWGRAEMGSNKSAAATMRVDASSVAVATGGINGAWTYFANPTGEFISTSKLVTEHGSTAAYGDESTYNATKVTYYTPSYAGFQGGVSYTPDSEARGQNLGSVATPTITAGYSNVWDFGVSYNTTFDNSWKLGLAGTYERADTDGVVATSDDTSSWNAGAVLGVAGFSLAGSYGEWNDATVTAGSADGDYWTAGLGYEAGPVGLSATYIDSTLELAAGDSDFSNLVFGADYKLAPGLTPYAEVSLFDADAAGAGADNEGTAVILGTQIAF